MQQTTLGFHGLHDVSIRKELQILEYETHRNERLGTVGQFASEILVVPSWSVGVSSVDPLAAGVMAE